MEGIAADRCVLQGLKVVKEQLALTSRLFQSPSAQPAVSYIWEETESGGWRHAGAVAPIVVKCDVRQLCAPCDDLLCYLPPAPSSAACKI